MYSISIDLDGSIFKTMWLIFFWLFTGQKTVKNGRFLIKNSKKISQMTDITNLHVLHSVVHDWQWKNTPTYIMLLIVHAMWTLIAL